MNKNRTENYVDGEITEAKLDAALVAKVNGVGLSHTHTLSQVTDAGDSAGLDVGTVAGTVAAGDHAHADLAPLASPTFTGTVTGTFSGNLTGNVTGTASGNLTSASTLDATKLSGTVADARLSSNVPLKNAANTFTGLQRIVTGNTTGNTGFLQLWNNANNGVAGTGTSIAFNTRDAAGTEYPQGRIGTVLVDGATGNPLSGLAFYVRGYNDAGITERMRIQRTGNVGIATDNPSCRLHVAGIDAVLVPVGSTGERPASPVNGMVRFNSTTKKYEGWVDSAWVDFH